MKPTQTIQATVDTRYQPVSQSTIYFIGMRTAQSAIMNVFPRWAEYLELGNVAIQGIDCRRHEQPAVYRRAVDFIKHDPLSRGALVTTHKIDLLKSCRAMFDYLDPHARLTGGVSCLAKRGAQLQGHAKDFLAGGLALEAFVPRRHWEATVAEAFCIGAGGASVALSCYLLDPRHGANRPARIIMSNDHARLWPDIKQVHRKLNGAARVEYHTITRPEDNDVLMGELKPLSLVINATGLGKDAPGSPITGTAQFPEKGLAWDFNYRGDLLFLEQARAQAKLRQLIVEDGWTYFIHGWTCVLAEVFGLEIPAYGTEFNELSRIAMEVRRSASTEKAAEIKRYTSTCRPPALTRRKDL